MHRLLEKEKKTRKVIERDRKENQQEHAQVAFDPAAEWFLLPHFYHGFAGPVELRIVHVAFSLEQILEEFSQILVIWSFKEVKSSNVTQVGGHFFWLVFAEHLYRSSSLRVADLLVPFLQGVCLQALPRQRASKEVHEHVTESFEIISSALF